MREAIRKLPDSEYRSEITNNPLGTRLRYPLKVTVADDTIELDFAGAPPQQPMEGLNSKFTYAAAHATYPMKCILSPGNSLQRRLSSSIHGKGARRLDPELQQTCQRQFAHMLGVGTSRQNVFRALAKVAPSQVQANTGLPHAMNIYGRDADSRCYADHFFIGGGQAHGRGKSALLYAASAANTSIELMKTRAPSAEKTSSPTPVAPASTVADSACAADYASCTTTTCRRCSPSIP